MRYILYGILVIGILSSCSTTQKTVAIQKQIVEDTNPSKSFLKRKVAIARFTNETRYAKGIFYQKENDPITNQALDILTTKLAASEKFLLLERNALDDINSETLLTDDAKDFQKVNADFIIVGSVTKYGRKNVGDKNIFSKSKEQIVEAGVSIRLIDVYTGQIIYSEEAQGKAKTKTSQILGLGETQGYDGTLSDEAISLAISQLVENIINNCMEKPWRSYFISYDDDGIFVGGGKTQGLSVGDELLVLEKGKRVKNPQTDMMMELPGKEVGRIKVDMLGGDNPINEFAMVSFISGNVDAENLKNYYIKEFEK